LCHGRHGRRGLRRRHFCYDNQRPGRHNNGVTEGTTFGATVGTIMKATEGMTLGATVDITMGATEGRCGGDTVGTTTGCNEGDEGAR
jgi:hypothetical protein